MGRELRRVPLDFDWPLNKPWKGFLNPFYGDDHRCTSCKDSRGYTNEALDLDDIVRHLLLACEASEGRGNQHPVWSCRADAAEGEEFGFNVIDGAY